MNKDHLEKLIKYEEIVSNASLSAVVFVVLSFIRHLSKKSFVVDLTDVWIISLGFFLILTVVDIIKRG